MADMDDMDIEEDVAPPPGGKQGSGNRHRPRRKHTHLSAPPSTLQPPADEDTDIAHLCEDMVSAALFLSYGASPSVDLLIHVEMERFWGVLFEPLAILCENRSRHVAKKVFHALNGEEKPGYFKSVREGLQSAMSHVEAKKSLHKVDLNPVIRAHLLVHLFSKFILKDELAAVSSWLEHDENSEYLKGVFCHLALSIVWWLNEGRGKAETQVGGNSLPVIAILALVQFFLEGARQRAAQIAQSTGAPMQASLRMDGAYRGHMLLGFFHLFKRFPFAKHEVQLTAMGTPRIALRDGAADCEDLSVVVFSHGLCRIDTGDIKGKAFNKACGKALRLLENTEVAHQDIKFSRLGHLFNDGAHVPLFDLVRGNLPFAHTRPIAKPLTRTQELQELQSDVLSLRAAGFAAMERAKKVKCGYCGQNTHLEDDCSEKYAADLLEI